MYMLTCHHIHACTEIVASILQWNLICSSSHLKAMTQAVYMAGLLVGSFAFGMISDRFGRRLSIFLSIFLLVRM